MFHVLARYIFLADLPRFLDFLPQLGIVKYDRGSVWSSIGEKEFGNGAGIPENWRTRRRNRRYYSPLALCFTSVARGEVNFSGKAFRPDRIIRDKNGPRNGTTTARRAQFIHMVYTRLADLRDSFTLACVPFINFK